VSNSETATPEADVESLREAITRHLVYTVGKDAFAA
jgi:hypothetical protein